MMTDPDLVAAVIPLVRDTLGLGEEVAISAGTLPFYDLRFTSMDLLDLIFRLEERFGVTIPEGTLYRLARGDLDDAEFCAQGHLTAQGRSQLLALLADSPLAIFPDRIHAATLQRFCTVAAFARLVAHLLAEAGRDRACSS